MHQNVLSAAIAPNPDPSAPQLRLVDVRLLTAAPTRVLDSLSAFLEAPTAEQRPSTASDAETVETIERFLTRRFTAEDVGRFAVQEGEDLGEAVCRLLEHALARGAFRQKTRAPATGAEPVSDRELEAATRPAGTPASPARRELEDAAEATGGVVTHAAGGVPVVVPAGEEPVGLPVQEVLPHIPPVAVDPVPDLKLGDSVAFKQQGEMYVTSKGAELPPPLVEQIAAAGGQLTIQKVSKRKDCLAVIVEGGWALRLVNGPGGVQVEEVRAPALPAATKQAPPRVTETPAPAATKQAPPRTETPAPSSAGPAFAASVAIAEAMLPKLEAADGIRGVMEALLSAGVPQEHMLQVCTAIKDKVPSVKKQPNLKDRVPRLLLIIGQAA